MRKSLIDNLPDSYFLTCAHKPKFIKSNCLFYREENYNYLTIISNKSIQSEQLIVNHTGKIILDLCDGSRTINEIYEYLTSLYSSTNPKIIFDDMIGMLFNFTVIEVLNWEGDNPFMVNLDKKIGEYTFKFATEDDLTEIINFVTTEKHEISIESLYNNNRYDLDIYLREILFTLQEEIFIVKENDKITGLVSVNNPVSTKSTAAIINTIIGEKKSIFELLKYMVETLKEIAITTISKVTLQLINESPEYEEIIDYILNVGFIKEGVLLKEFDDKDALRLSYVY